MADGYPNEIPLITNLYKAVSMQHALATGFAGMYSLESDKEKGVTIDLTTDTPGKRAIDGMIARAIAAVGESDTLKKLLAKPQWNKNDRVQWELSIADISRDEIFSEPRFGNYRLERDKKMTPISITEIDKDTNFHCEPMAVMSGIMVQRLENHFLQPSDDKSQLKRRTDYYLTGGLVYESAFQKNKKPIDVIRQAQNGETLHAFIVSPITANYIEGTIGRPNGWNGSAPTTYQSNSVKGYTFDDYLAGYPMLANDAGFTIGYDGSLKAKQVAQKRKEAIKAGDYSVLAEARVSFEQMEFNPFIVADERNIARVFAPVVAAQEGDEFTIAHEFDRIQRVSKLVGDRLQNKCQPYTELLALSKRVDFAVSQDDAGCLLWGNRMVLWAKEKPLIERILGDDDSLLKQGPWKEQELAGFLADRGVSEVWVQRAIPKDAVPTANNFEQVVRSYYDTLPESRLKPEKEKQVSAAARRSASKKNESNDEEKVEFSQYLEFSKRQYLAKGGRPEAINAPGTMVPVLLNPLRQWEISKKLNGRTYNDYEKQDVIADAYTEALIVNRPGVENDKVFINASGVINGNRETRQDWLKVVIPESVGELPDPLPTVPAGTVKARARTARP